MSQPRLRCNQASHRGCLCVGDLVSRSFCRGCGWHSEVVDDDTDAALAQWTKCLPLINHENRQCGLRACKVVMKEGGVIGSDHVRHPLKPMTPRTRERLLQLAGDLDLIALKWGK